MSLKFKVYSLIFYFFLPDWRFQLVVSRQTITELEHSTSTRHHYRGFHSNHVMFNNIEMNYIQSSHQLSD